MTKQPTPKITRRSPKVTFSQLRDNAEAKIGKTELFARFNMYRIAIGMKLVTENTFKRYHSGYKGTPIGTNAVYADFLKAIK
jgi:hypothetical protein